MTKILDKTINYGPFIFSKHEGEDVFNVDMPVNEVFHSSRLTILDSNFGGTARITSQPSFGQSGTGKITVAWTCEGSSDVKFQVEAFSCSTDNQDSGVSPTQQMTGFLPSVHGWPFDNRFSKIPPFTLIGELKYGDASKGMCGGMVYAALDYFHAKKSLPKIPRINLDNNGSPISGSVFDYLGKRLFDSFDLPAGVRNFIELMLPIIPDFQASKAIIGTIPRNRAWRMIRQEWPNIKAMLDAKEPCPLGLVRVKSKELSKLGENHQVLAYGYDVAGEEVTLFIYDPNFHHDDKVTLKFNVGDPGRKPIVTYSDQKSIFCFFMLHYKRSTPP